MIISFSTVLEIDGRPTLYNVYRNRGACFFKSLNSVHVPILYALYQNSTLGNKGTEDVAIKQQVLNEISIPD